MNAKLKVPLWLELTAIVIIKLFCLTLLWWFCFSKPNIAHVNNEIISTHLFLQNKDPS